MPADKLGRFMTSEAFLTRAKASVKKAVENLEAKGIEPAYAVRDPKDDELFASLPDPTVAAVLVEVFERGQHAELHTRLMEIAATPAGAQQIHDATVAVASVLLLCKTAMPHEGEAFAKRVSEQMAAIRDYAALAELALLLIEGEQSTEGDSFRDRNVISDALFEQRIEIIKQTLQH